MTRKKLIEVALPLEAINVASAREKSIRHGHPSTLHLWWARRPLAACRAVIFASLVDDPGHHPEDQTEPLTAPPEFIAACRQLPKGKNATGFDEKGRSNDTPRMRLFDFIERLVQWESTTDERVLETARELIRLATGGNPPPLLDPFAGGGSIPLEAQRLGLEAHASDLNPVAVMINKALIEIPPKFANRPPVNPVSSNRFSGSATEVATTNRGQRTLLQGEWQGAAGLAADVRYYGEWMRDRAFERIGHLYPEYTPPVSPPPQPSPAGGGSDFDSSPQRGEAGRGAKGETVIAWLWARTVACPNPACGAQMPLVSSFELSKKKGRPAWVEPVIDRQAKTVRFTVKTGQGTPPDPPKLGRGANFRCLVCDETASDPYIKDQGKAGRMGAQLMTIVTEGNSGRSYYAPTPEHEQIAAQAKPAWAPGGELPGNARWFSPPLFGMTDFADLFTPRQLTALTTFSDLVAEARQQIEADARAAWGMPPPQPSPSWGGSQTSPPAGGIEGGPPLRDGGSGAKAYAEAVSVYLAFAVDRSADYWCTITTWSSHVKMEALRNAFSRQALPMTWDFAEGSPFSGSSGNWLNNLEWGAKSIENLYFEDEGVCNQADAQTEQKFDRIIVSTDPPYYDNIGYADLSDFFYVWLRRSIRDIFPDIFGTLLVPKKPELVATPFRFGGDGNKANAYFENGLKSVFHNLRNTVLAEFPTTVYYAFKQSEKNLISLSGSEAVASTGWETMLEGLIGSGFVIQGSWPVRTEYSSRTVATGTNALASSIVIVCRPRPDNAPLTSRREFVNALRRELPPALKEMQSGNIAPVDLAQASIGPGMAVYSRYGQVLEPDGSRLSVRTALQLINQELDAYLAEQEGVIDPDSRFAVAWFEQFGFKAAGFGQADVLARAKNTSVEGLANAGLLEAGAGKVRLLPWEELDPGWDPANDTRLTVWEATHHLIERLNAHGEQGTAMLLAKLSPELAAEARQLAYRLYSICERKGWADHARDYNALVISWSASQEQAVQLKEQYQQGTLFG